MKPLLSSWKIYGPLVCSVVKYSPPLVFTDPISVGVGWVGGELHVASLVTEQFPSLPVSLPQQARGQDTDVEM